MLVAKDILAKVYADYLQVTRNKVPYVTGRTYDSIEGEITSFRLIITAADYAGVLEQGRANGKMPPIEPIQQWVEKKGLDISPWAIAKKIQKEGTQLFRGSDPRYQKPSGVLLDQIPDILEANESLFYDYIQQQVEQTLTTEWYR